MNQMPVVLIASSKSKGLVNTITHHDDFDLLEIIGPNDIGRVCAHQKDHYDLLVVIDLQDMTVREAVMTGLLLRNRGEQVFISCSEDYSDLCELARDIYEFISKEKPNGPIRTELLVTARAETLLGDVRPIIEEFERKFMK